MKDKLMKNRIIRDVVKNRFFYLLAIPGVIVMILFSYIPIAGIYVAFEDYTFQGGLFGSKFVGLKNFEFFFANAKNAWRATKNTLIINGGAILIGTFVRVAVAIMLGEMRREKFRKVIQTSILFPYFLSWIVIGALSEMLLANNGGMINQIIEAFGGNPINFEASPQYWHAIIIFATVWKEFGYGSIIYYATLTGFDQSLYEAAKIDGAGRWQCIWKITVPLLMPTIVLMFLLSIGGILRGSLDQIMGMTKLNPFLLETTDTITTFVYRTTTKNAQFGTASAIGLYQSVFGCILVLTANFLAKKADPDYAMF